MTLVVSYISAKVAIQVADRLVSVSYLGRSEIQPLDECAVKQIVFIGRDGICVIGYAGRAFIGCLPTDEWIANLLTGGAATRNAEGAGGFAMGDVCKPMDVGKAMRLICEQLQGRLKKEDLVQIRAAGFQWNHHGLARPLWYRFDVSDGRIQSPVMAPRHVTRNGACIMWAGMLAEPERLKHLCQTIVSNESKVTPSWIAEQLVDFVRACRAPGIGANVSAVTIPNPAMGESIRCRFFPMERHVIGRKPDICPRPEVLRADDHSQEGREVHHFPWIVGPGGVFPPSCLAGPGMSVNVGGLSVVFEGLPVSQDNQVATLCFSRRFQLPRGVQ